MAKPNVDEPTVHFRVSRYSRPDTACGRWPTQAFTLDIEKVTCGRCRSSRAYRYKETEALIRATQQPGDGQEKER